MEDREGSESVKSTVRVDKREKSVYETETKKKQEIMREREREIEKELTGFMYERYPFQLSLEKRDLFRIHIHIPTKSSISCDI